MTQLQDKGAASAGNRLKKALKRHFQPLDEGELVRWTFRGLLLGAFVILAIDLGEMVEVRAAFTGDSAPAAARDPILPPAPGNESSRANAPADPRHYLTTSDDALSIPMRFELQQDGRLLAASGSIDVGAGARFATELAARGDDVETISLNSPGGSLDDAIAMARLIREKGLATEVEAGALCASSCPLVLAGGTARNVSDKAAVGVHQFYTVGEATYEPAQAMAHAQVTTARISRHLAAMGVDGALWLHALETPPSALYYLSPEELSAYRVVTDPPELASR
ncbi:COG3904 family protein [Mesorhizobium xinjiangense]|uniref:COG3904 family protein n=1 Tax=Mesorhizobium xinjiangense TaxID=2678685 RepID=UPI001F2327B2|nr:hypothetical protein [Mesorhizobium xinjiangense]